MSLREATVDDHAAIVDVARRNGLDLEISRPQWDALWLGNPFRQHADEPVGWVLEGSAGAVVGVLLCVRRGYEWNQTLLHASVASTWAVDEGHRLSALSLISRYLAQPEPDVLLLTSANAAASKVYRRMRLERLPHPEFTTHLAWITRYREHSERALRDREQTASSLLRFPAAAALRLKDAVEGRNRQPSRDRRVRRIEAFDERFDGLWEGLRQVPDRLQGVRSRAALAWQFESPMRNGTCWVVACEEGSTISGYAIVARLGPTLKVVDLQTLEGPAGVEGLLAATLSVARERGAAELEVVGLEPRKRAVLERFAPRHRTNDAWPFFFKASDPELAAALTQPAAWDPSLFDGDSSLPL